MKKINETSSVFYEKYKPQLVEDLILPEQLKLKIQKFVDTQQLPHILLASDTGGTGKSATANAIIKEIGGEAMWVNASMENGIDTLRGKIAKFASQVAFDDNVKIVVMDECLEENEKVRIGSLDNWEGVKLNSLEKGVVYDCVSFNMNTGNYENDTCEIISDKEDIIYEVQLGDGRTVKVTGNHPFIVNENGKYIEKSINDGLCEDDDVVCVK